MTSHGTKVTSIPATTYEPTGLVTSDSLAADSLSSGGSFAASNPHAAASKQPSSSTTSNTTDTSSATTLPPAPNAEAREAREGRENAGSEPGGGEPSYEVGKGGKAGGVERAPTGGYAGAAEQARSKGEFRPHGANITEDEHLSGTTAFGAVGTKLDPSRVAEEERVKRAAVQPGSLGGGKDGSVQGESKFSGLGEEEA